MPIHDTDCQHSLRPPFPFCRNVPQPEQIRQCLVDYASINVWSLEGGTEEAPGINLHSEAAAA
jgi:hypothetical protein